MNATTTILAVDDTPESLALLVTLLGAEGYRVLPADSGELALSAAIMDPPDLILLDLRMPGMGGLETCTRLKADNATRLIPIILMSAYAEVGEWVEGLRAGAADYITKPFQTEELLSRIKTQLELRQATVTLERSVAERTEELRQANQRLEALWSLSALFDMDDIGEKAIHDFVLDKIVRMSGSRYSFLGTMNKDETVMHIHSWSGEAMKDWSMVDKPVDYRITEVGVWGEAVRNRKPLILNDYAAPHEAKKGYPTGHVPLTRLMVVPAFSGGRIVSVAAVANKDAEYTDADLKQLNAFMNGVEAVLDRRRVWEELRKSEIKYHSVADFTWDMETWRAPDGRFIYVSPSCERITGYKVGDFLADPELTLKLAHPDDKERLALHYAQEGQKDEGEDRHIDFRTITKDGQLRWISHFCRQINDSEGNPLGRRASNRDITERRLAEDRVNTLLREKELLLREVHHRVKNNMNSMASLLSMQAASLRNPVAKEALNEAQGRLKSMGVLYDKIYRSENLQDLSIREYLPSLLAEIVRIFPSNVTVGTDIELEDFMLEVRTLMPLGIVMNEIITNSLKYAFSGRDVGTISARAFRICTRATIVIGDDGIGMPASINPENSSGFGLTLIRALMDQIDGTVRIDQVEGTTFTLEFGLAPGGTQK